MNFRNFIRWVFDCCDTGIFHKWHDDGYVEVDYCFDNLMEKIDHCDDKQQRRHCEKCNKIEYYNTNEGMQHGWWPVPCISERQKQKDMMREVLRESKQEA